jgi:hypothetical protein
MKRLPKSNNMTNKRLLLAALACILLFSPCLGEGQSGLGVFVAFGYIFTFFGVGDIRRALDKTIFFGSSRFGGRGAGGFLY